MPYDNTIYFKIQRGMFKKKTGNINNGRALLSEILGLFDFSKTLVFKMAANLTDEAGFRREIIRSLLKSVLNYV